MQFRTSKSITVGAICMFTVATSVAVYQVRTAIHPSVNEQLETARQQVVKGNLDQASGYAQSVLMGKTITAHVNYGNAAQKSDCERSVLAAFSMWEEALKGQVKFQLVDLEEDAEVKIQFSKNTKLNGQIVSGYINWTRTIQVGRDGVQPIFSADVRLRSTDPSGSRLSFEAMRHTAGHELGHLFGLDDVRQVGKLMGPLDVRRPVDRPDAGEIETVMAIREECRQIMQKAAKGSHAQFFHQACKHSH